jgi:hypothetical protein
MLLPAMRFVAELYGGRSLLALVNGAEVGPPINVDQGVNDVFSSRLRTIELLDAIQDITGIYFAVPRSISPTELADIHEAYRLLDGEVLIAEWDRLKITVPGDSPVVAALQEHEGRAITGLYTSSELVLQLGAQVYPIGQVRQTVRTATFVELDEVIDDTEPEGSVRITFIPGDDQTMETRLITQDKPGPQVTMRCGTDCHKDSVARS